MSDRWICSRCYTSAEGGATICPNCGLPRGAVAPNPADAEPEADSAAMSASAEPVHPDPAQAELAPAVPAATTELERWVCLRCFASNDGAAATCATCGLSRGVDPNADHGMDVPPESPRPSWTSRIPWRYVAYGVFILIALGGSALFAARRDDGGEVTDAGDLSVYDLQVGDCFDVGTEATEIDTVRAIPCDEPHTYEMFWAGDYPDDTQPTEDEYLSWLEDQCLPAFEDYVGLSYAESEYYMGSLSPTKESWGNGDRAFSCYLYNASETAMSGSVEGTAR